MSYFGVNVLIVIVVVWCKIAMLICGNVVAFGLVNDKCGSIVAASWLRTYSLVIVWCLCSCSVHISTVAVQN